MHRLFVLPVCIFFVVAGCDSSGANEPSEQKNQAPSSDFSFTPQEPRAGQGVSFTANVSDSDGQIVTYSWDFDNDGLQDASGSSPTFEFESFGTYTASLMVTDDDGETDRATRSIRVAQRYTQATITSVTVEEMPFSDQSGSGWDLTSGPEVYFASFDGSDQNVTISSYLGDVGPGDLPLRFSDGDFSISDLSERFSLALFDRDATNDDDFIGGITFDLAGQIGSYPSSFTLDAGAGIVLKIALDWSLGNSPGKSVTDHERTMRADQARGTFLSHGVPASAQLRPREVPAATAHWGKGAEYRPGRIRWRTTALEEANLLVIASGPLSGCLHQRSRSADSVSCCRRSGALRTAPARWIACRVSRRGRDRSPRD